MLTCIVHEDGHVVAMGNGHFRHLIHEDAAILSAFGRTGYHVEDIEDHYEAARRFREGDRCTVCTPTLPCGCRLKTVVREGCPHEGTQAAVTLMRNAVRRQN